MMPVPQLDQQEAQTLRLMLLSQAPLSREILCCDSLWREAMFWVLKSLSKSLLCSGCLHGSLDGCSSHGCGGPGHCEPPPRLPSLATLCRMAAQHCPTQTLPARGHAHPPMPSCSGAFLVAEAN